MRINTNINAQIYSRFRPHSVPAGSVTHRSLEISTPCDFVAALIDEREAIERILRHLGLREEPFRLKSDFLSTIQMDY